MQRTGAYDDSDTEEANDMALSPEARHALARARAELGSVKARQRHARCPHGGTADRCHLCRPVAVDDTRDDKVLALLYDE